MRAALVVAAAAVLLASGCKREERSLRDEPAQRAMTAPIREGELVPGGKIPGVSMHSPAEGNAYAVSQGQQLYSWYNCASCHGLHGGGGMGPPLTSEKLIYGSEPQNVFDTIIKGRPRGMPSWGGRIPESQVWQLVAFVRSLSGKQPLNATGARTDYVETKTKAQLK
jgi:cytochrome c oxidase cbb3-type subunit 3